MENVLEQSKEEEQIELPPGFRFHPTDEELITHYLSPKVVDNCFCSIAIGEVDLNKCEPWDLPRRAKMGEKQWYFFSVRDRKYPTGLRTNRATNAGYWKATGKDKEIYKMKILVGMKKTLVFYKGRAPKGEKTNWVMHEFRVEGNFSIYNLPKSAKNEWVICRIFHKISCAKKSVFSGLDQLNAYEEKMEASELPPLKDSSSCNDDTIENIGDSIYVTCFSNATENRPSQHHMIDTFKNPISLQNTFHTWQNFQNIENLHHPNPDLIQDQSILMANHEALCSSTIPIFDIDSFWN